MYGTGGAERRPLPTDIQPDTQGTLAERPGEPSLKDLPVIKEIYLVWYRRNGTASAPYRYPA
ncbi:MAG: hypothetical protein ACYC0V_17005 [Armatimonadota bacterium]